MIGEEEYFRTVEDYFLQKIGTPKILSPKDFRLILEWYEAEIPVEVVFRGIDAGQETLKKKDDELTSLQYCKRLVKREHKRYLKSLEGTPLSDGASGPAPENIQEYLVKMVDSLGVAANDARLAQQSALADMLSQKMNSLQQDILVPFQQNPSQDLQRVEEQLTHLEKDIEAVLLSVIPEDQIEQFKEQAMRELKAFEGKLELAVYQEMLRRALIKSIRSLYRIPRLSLFYM